MHSPMDPMNEQRQSIEWNQVLEEVAGIISPSYFQNFISPLKFIRKDDTTILLLAPSDHVRRHVESKYLNYLEKAFYNVLKNRFKVEIVTEAKEFSDSWNRHITESIDSNFTTLNPDCTFSSFIVADSNRLAYTACMEAVLRPGDINPLYIFGSVGVGKTHLLHAMGNEILKREPWKKVRYVEMTSFLNEFIFTVRQNTRQALDSFKLKYQSYDTLLIDDIQFLNSGADKTQEEFFSLFNFLYQRKSQIVIASDRPSHELPIHDRLKSRFTKGVQTNIQPPSEDLRFAILRKYCDMYDLHLDSESLEFLVKNITGDVRYLIGALNDIILFRKAYNYILVPLDRVKEIVQSRIDTRKKLHDLTQDALIDRICASYNQSRKDILGKSRKSEYIIPRHLCMFALHRFFHLNKTVIGRIFDCKHTTVLHGIANIESRLKTDRKIQELIQELELEFDLI